MLPQLFEKTGVARECFYDACGLRNETIVLSPRAALAPKKLHSNFPNCTSDILLGNIVISGKSSATSMKKPSRTVVAKAIGKQALLYVQTNLILCH